MELAGFSVFRVRRRTRKNMNKAEGVGEEGEGSRRGEICQIQIPLITS